MTERCPKCGSRVFFVDETSTYLKVNGELVKQLGGGDIRLLDDL